MTRQPPGEKVEHARLASLVGSASEEAAIQAKIGRGEPTQAATLVKIARERFEFGCTPAGIAFVVPRVGPYVAYLLRGGRQSLRHELVREFSAAQSRPPNGSALRDALLQVESESLAVRPRELALRVGVWGNNVILDLGRVDGQVVEVGPTGWRLRTRSPVLFRRTELTSELPVPQTGGTTDQLWGLLNVAVADRPLVVGWLVAALLADIPHPILLLRGLQGSAKTTTARTLVSLLDPSAAPLRSVPADLGDWSVAASGSWVVGLDNVSRIPEWLSDAICRAVTGDGLVKRRLYSDSSLEVLSFHRVVVLTGIDVGALRGDLADRLLVVELDPIAPTQRRQDAELAFERASAQPRLLGALLDLTVRVLGALPKVERGEGWPRMADFARVLAAVDAVLGTKALARYETQARGLAVDVIESDPVAEALLRTVLPGGELKVTATELLKAMSPELPPRGWPDSGQKLSGRLRRLVPAMAQLGVELTFEKEGKDRRRVVTVKRAAEADTDYTKTAGSRAEGEADQASAASAASSPSSKPCYEADASSPSADEPSAHVSAGFRDQADAADAADGGSSTTTINILRGTPSGDEPRTEVLAGLDRDGHAAPDQEVDAHQDVGAPPELEL